MKVEPGLQLLQKTNILQKKVATLTFKIATHLILRISESLRMS
jgi:hypothetical protein